MIHGETLHSTMPWDIPWWDPDHVVFFSVLYLVLLIVGSAVNFAAVKAFLDSVTKPLGHGHGSH